MKLTKAKSKIVGVRVGEISLSALRHDQTRLSVNFVLLGDPKTMDGLNAGKYTKEGMWSQRAIDALGKFIEVLEEEALHELFEVKESPESGDKEEDAELSFPNVPTLGGDGGGIPQV